MNFTLGETDYLWQLAPRPPKAICDGGVDARHAERIGVIGIFRSRIETQRVSYLVKAYAESWTLKTPISVAKVLADKNHSRFNSGPSQQFQQHIREGGDMDKRELEYLRLQVNVLYDTAVRIKKGDGSFDDIVQEINDAAHSLESRLDLVKIEL